MNLHTAFLGAVSLCDWRIGNKRLAGRFTTNYWSGCVADTLPGQFSSRPVANNIYDGLDIRRGQMLSQDYPPEDGSSREEILGQSFATPTHQQLLA